MKEPARKEDKPSFWTTLPGTLTGLAAVLTAIGALVAALNSAGLLRPRATPTPFATPPPAVTSTTSPATSTAIASGGEGTGFPGCFQPYFQSMSNDRVSLLETGSQAFQLIGPDQTKSEPFGILLTDNNQPVGGIILQYFSDGQIFKVETVVDSSCKATQNYLNETRGGDKNTLQNFDSLRLRFGKADYELRLDYDGSISADFRTFTPWVVLH